MRWPFSMSWRLGIQRRVSDDLRKENHRLRMALEEAAQRFRGAQSAIETNQIEDKDLNGQLVLGREAARAVLDTGLPATHDTPTEN